MERLTRYRGNVVSVRNLDDTVTSATLREAFSQFGRIVTAEVVMEGGTYSRGYGLICFGTAEEAGRAVEEMNGRVIGSKTIECTLSGRKEDRQAYLASLHAQTAQQQGHYRQPGTSRGYVPTRRVYIPSTKTSEVNSPRWITQTFHSDDDDAPTCSNITLRRHLIPEVPDIEVFPPSDQQLPSEGLQGVAVLARQFEAPLTESALSVFSPEEQKDMLGEKLFPIVQQLCHHLAHLAGKITGMILELDNIKILHMLEHYDLLKEKVEEAIAVLKAANYVESTVVEPECE